MGIRWAVLAFIFSTSTVLALESNVPPRDPKELAWVNARKKFWAFQPPVRPEVPKGTAAKNPIDAFIQEQLRAKGLTPAAPLGRRALIRRATLDLTGLPPTPAEVDAFVADRSPDAYEKVVDRLLASRHYGERWAQRWLDVVRYADTNGYELDAERPQAWRYRDYVIDAFNSGKPYDRFIQEQVAGDELFPGNKEALVATGFHRAGPIHLVGGNQDEEMNRQEVLTEMAASVSSSFLGLTVGCAKCHNHKFDPILQSDYYRLQAILAATDYKDIEIATPEEKAAAEKAKAEHEAKLKPLKDQIAAIEKPYREQLRAEKKKKLEPKYLEVLDVPAEKRSEEQKRLAKEAKEQIEASWDEVVAIIPEPEKSRRAGLRKQMHAIDLYAPDPVPSAYAVTNMDKAPTTYILKVGDHKNKLAPVEPGFLTVLAPETPVPTSPQGRRSALAQWLASPNHPLTARVMVNRIWQFRMGVGIVATPNDFGTLGARPSNQKLLDWLATEFVASGWNVKAIDRLLVTSAVYKQVAVRNAANARIDSENKYFWSANRRRLEAEAVRDNVLAVTGALNLQSGGAPIRVPIEQEVYDIIFTEAEPDNLWPVNPDPKQLARRSLYLLSKRTVRLPMMTNFDQPDAMTSCAARTTSTHALQALSLMNSDFMTQQAARFAERLQAECGAKETCRVQLAWKLALARPPKPEEVQLTSSFFRKGGRWNEFCLALLNRNEFIYLP